MLSILFAVLVGLFGHHTAIPMGATGGPAGHHIVRPADGTLGPAG